MVNLAQSPVNLIATIGASQMASRAIGMGLQSAGKNLVDEESIKAEAGRSINEIIASHREELNIICATDEFNYEVNGGSSKVLQNDLDRGIEHAVYKHQGKFHSDGATFLTGFAGQVGSAFVQPFGFGNILSAAMQFGIGQAKNAEAVRKVHVATEQVIGSTVKKALSSGTMMERLLSKNLGTDAGSQLFKEAKGQALIKNGEIEYKKCDFLVYRFICCNCVLCYDE